MPPRERERSRRRRGPRGGNPDRPSQLSRRERGLYQSRRFEVGQTRETIIAVKAIGVSGIARQIARGEHAIVQIATIETEDEQTEEEVSVHEPVRCTERFHHSNLVTLCRVLRNLGDSKAPSTTSDRVRI